MIEIFKEILISEKITKSIYEKLKKNIGYIKTYFNRF